MLKRIGNITGLLFLVVVLTVLTQVGGIILLLFLLIWRFVKKRKWLQNKKKWVSTTAKITGFLFFYFFISFIIVPLVAKQFGRVPLPVFSNTSLQPLNIITVLLNRHYVNEELHTTITTISTEMNVTSSGSIIAYLDANFPFMDGFPLLPHLSHNDGKKLDLAFFYKDAETEEQLNDAAPSFIGYGVFETPKKGEQNKPEFCAENGHWQYSILGAIVPQWNNGDYIFDQQRTQTLVNQCIDHPSIGEIFIEPHLKDRMNLHADKVRFHGCGAVRHDDHIHIQLK